MKPNERGKYPDIFYTRESNKSSYDGQWVLGWLKKEAKTELTFEVIGASKTYDKVETLLKNKSGLDRMVSDAREIHSFKSVGLVTKGTRKRRK